MSRKHTERHIPCSMEAEILKKIGDNKTNEKTFNNGVTIREDGGRNELNGFYTYRGQVCILDGMGMDVEFSSYTEDNKTIIHKAIMSNNYV